MRVLSLIFLGALIAALVQGQTFTGKWTAQANGTALEIHLWQNGGAVHGYAIDSRSGTRSELSGSVSGKEIRFARSGGGLRVPQEYRGYYFEIGPAAVAGIFSHEGTWNNGWYALRSGAPEGVPVGASGGTRPGAGVGPCGWRDGMDPSAPPDDPGRGFLSAGPHLEFANSSGRGQAPRLFARRVASLRGCLGREGYARVYADVSVKIAQAGRSQAGWLDGMDPAAPADDPGRGLSNWQTHFDYVNSGPGETTIPGLLERRLATLQSRIGVGAFANLYAELSVTLARYGVSGGGR
jgi:hypothetical protein